MSLCEVILGWISWDTFDEKSTFVHVMAWYRQATSHYLCQYWLRFLCHKASLRHIGLIISMYTEMAVVQLRSLSRTNSSIETSVFRQCFHWVNLKLMNSFFFSLPFRLLWRSVVHRERSDILTETIYNGTHFLDHTFSVFHLISQEPGRYYKMHLIMTFGSEFSSN